MLNRRIGEVGQKGNLLRCDFVFFLFRITLFFIHKEIKSHNILWPLEVYAPFPIHQKLVLRNNWNKI